MSLAGKSTMSSTVTGIPAIPKPTTRLSENGWSVKDVYKRQGNIYKYHKSRGRAVVALLCGVLVMAAVMAAANLVITPLFMGTPVSAVKAMLLPVIIPFNLIKAGINALITFLVYKPLARYLHGENLS